MLEINTVRAGYDRTPVLHGVTARVPPDGVGPSSATTAPARAPSCAPSWA
jgi:hypothetical protein